jgi:hypothetical protein
MCCSPRSRVTVGGSTSLPFPRMASGSSPGARTTPRNFGRQQPAGRCSPSSATQVQFIKYAFLPMASGSPPPALMIVKLWDVATPEQVRVWQEEERAAAKRINQKFPFTRNPWPRMEFIDAWRLLQPYIGTNGSFYVCPADRGPYNFVMITKVWASWSPVAGIKTNDLPCPNSYWYWMAFFSQGSDWTQSPRQRSVSEVKYPSQKIIMECDALDPKHSHPIAATS